MYRDPSLNLPFGWGFPFGTPRCPDVEKIPIPTLIERERNENEQVGKISVSKLLPGIIGCTGAVVVASENASPEAALVLKLRTETGEEVLLPLSERGAKQVQKVIGEFNRSRDLLFFEDRLATQATLQ